jgi:hypothetical protein
MTESEGRAAIIEAGKKWLGTRYTNSGCLRGCGANCAMLLYGIARDAGVIAPEVPEPAWYSPQLHAHSREERLLKNIAQCGAVEILEDDAKPGDVVAYLTGQSHGHLALIVSWPLRIIQTTQANGCQYAHGREGTLAGCSMKFYSLWPPVRKANKSSNE